MTAAQVARLVQLTAELGKVNKAMRLLQAQADGRIQAMQRTRGLRFWWHQSRAHRLIDLADKVSAQWTEEKEKELAELIELAKRAGRLDLFRF